MPGYTLEGTESVIIDRRPAWRWTFRLLGDGGRWRRGVQYSVPGSHEDGEYTLLCSTSAGAGGMDETVFDGIAGSFTTEV